MLFIQMLKFLNRKSAIIRTELYEDHKKSDIFHEELFPWNLLILKVKYMCE